MLSSKAHFVLRSTIRTGYTNGYNHCIKQGLQYLCMSKTCNNNTNSDSLNNGNISRQHVKCLCTKAIPKETNVFGDLAYEKYNRVQMDMDEEKEERFSENVFKIPRMGKLTPGKYADLIKFYIGKKDLNLALHVLELVKKNDDQPTLYMYSLLIRAFAVQGDIVQCFKLYNKMKKYGFNPNEAIYTSLINSCAISKDSKLALDRLHYLRQLFYEKGISLNSTHYATFIKAYSLHNDDKTAFAIADEANDQNCITSDIYANLFYATISNKQNGLKYALGLWHQMKMRNIPVSIIHYNLLLRAIRDTMFGNLKANECLLPGQKCTQILLADLEKSDLLQMPPILSTLLLKFINKEEFENNMSSENTIEKELIGPTTIISENLNGILRNNKLILFGGIKNILQYMKNDKVQPDIKTMSLLLELVPPSIEAEEFIISFAKQENIKLNITFFNILIRRRNKRKRYNEAMAVLDKIQSHNLTPDILTFGVLAMGCIRPEQGLELLQQMSSIGLVPNKIVLGTLVYNACYQIHFEYVIKMMKYISKNHIIPSEYILSSLERFELLVLKLIKHKTRWNRAYVKTIEAEYNTFKILYDEWKHRVQENAVVKMSK